MNMGIINSILKEDKEKYRLEQESKKLNSMFIVNELKLQKEAQEKKEEEAIMKILEEEV